MGDPWLLPPWKKAALAAGIPMIEARRQLADTNVSAALNAEGIYDLVLAATDDEEQARKAMIRRANDRLIRGQPA